MEKLTGKFKHYCYDWDEMAIDETCPEFEFCLCGFGPQQAEVSTIQQQMYAAKCKAIESTIKTWRA